MAAIHGWHYLVGSEPGTPIFTILGFLCRAVAVNVMGITGYSNSVAAHLPIDDVERVEV